MRLHRPAAGGLALVLVLLTAFSIWTAARTSAASAKVDRYSALVAAFHRARFAIAEQESLVLRYEATPSPDARDRAIAAARDVTAGLGYVAAHGNPGDRTLARRLLRGTQVYMAAATQMFSARAAGERVRARAIESEFEAVYPWVESSIRAAAERNSALSAAALRSLRDTERFVLLATPAVFAAGLAALAALTAVLVRTRRRYERAQQRELARLERAAFVDSLTGLLNHRAMKEGLAAALARRDVVVVAMLDVDGLKPANDVFGHHVGDELLRRTAAALEAAASADDELYRIGGDEFLAVLGGATVADALAFVRRANEAAGEGVAFTAGIAAAAGDAARDELLAHADRALIEAKRRHQPLLVYGDEIAVLTAPVELEERHVRTLATALARAVDAKDSYTRSHCETVSNLCGRIAEQLGLPSEHVRRIRLAGLLHDVGKIGIADAILQKPGRLTDEEFAVMRTHATLGHSIVHAAELEDEAQWVRHHHERWDGAGYPDGLARVEIPLESRIILVADAFEAITSDRPYRAGRPVADALAELERHAGTQFDPRCVAALRAALDGEAATAETLRLRARESGLEPRLRSVTAA
jgi:diguanylate cyclase (GGDEF)-like protein/putative nucleotidyltransferase with HDIG domain